MNRGPFSSYRVSAGRKKTTRLTTQTQHKSLLTQSPEPQKNLPTLVQQPTSTAELSADLPASEHCEYRTRSLPREGSRRTRKNNPKTKDAMPTCQIPYIYLGAGQVPRPVLLPDTDQRRINASADDSCNGHHFVGQPTQSELASNSPGTPKGYLTGQNLATPSDDGDRSPESPHQVNSNLPPHQYHVATPSRPGRPAVHALPSAEMQQPQCGGVFRRTLSLLPMAEMDTEPAQRQPLAVLSPSPVMPYSSFGGQNPNVYTTLMINQCHLAPAVVCTSTSPFQYHTAVSPTSTQLPVAYSSSPVVLQTQPSSSSMPAAITSSPVNDCGEPQSAPYSQHSLSSSLRTGQEDGDSGSSEEEEATLSPHVSSSPEGYTCDYMQYDEVEQIVENEDEDMPESSNQPQELHCLWHPPDSSPCNEVFQQMSDMVEHINNQHVNSITNREFSCSWWNCERRGVPFKAKYKLVNHVRVHTNEKPFVCKAPNCGRLFARSENLRIHMRVHSGEKPFKCPHPGCHKSFANSSDRKKHTFVHSQERPYSCRAPGCMKRYTHPSSLRKHAQLHKSPGVYISP